jgi:FAD/FMN-containing dehydrogenase
MMEVVTAAGEVVRASETENRDLFWALRGGSGNFGLVTSFTYRTESVGPEIVGGAVAWAGEDCQQVMKFYREFSAAVPRELTSALVLRNAPAAPWLPKDVHGKPVIMMLAVYSGKLEDGERLTAAIKAFGKPVADILVRRPYTQMQSLLDATQPPGRRYYWKSEFLSRIDDGVIDSLTRRSAQMPSPHAGLILFQIGGALNSLPLEHSPAGNRDAAYVANIATSWEGPEHDAANVAWTRATWDELRPFSTGGAYVNFMTEDEGPERTQSAYGSANLARLAELKRKLDPDNVFRHCKSVSGG